MYKLPTLLSILVSERVDYDVKTGTFNIVGVFSDLNFSSLPAKKNFIFSFVIAGYDKTSANICIQICDKYGYIVLEKKDNIQVEAGKDRLMYAGAFNGFPFNEEGVYTFKLFFNGMEYEENRLTLRVAKVALSVKDLVKKHFG